jgi:hypothetical protein
MEDFGIPQALAALRVGVILITAISSSAMKVFHTMGRVAVQHQSVPPHCEHDHSYIPVRTHAYGRKGGEQSRILNHLQIFT